MKFILFYHKATLNLGRAFEQTFTQQWGRVDIEIFKTIESIKDRIGNNIKPFENEIYIFLADSKSRLLELSQLNHLMEDKKIILIVPDMSEEIMRVSVRFSPRFITRISEDYEDVHLVLKQMAGKFMKYPVNHHGYKPAIREYK